MKFFIEEIPVFFPFDVVYPEQIQLMYILKKLFDYKCHGIISLPPSINFPISTIGFFLSYNFYSKLKSKLIYCTSSDGNAREIILKSTVFSEKNPKKFNRKFFPQNPIILALAEKDQLCINSKIQSNFKKDQIDDLCNGLITPFFFSGISNRKKTNFPKKALISYSKRPLRCLYFYNFENKKTLSPLKGIWSIEKLQKLGIKRKICPFFFLRKKIGESNVLITNLNTIFLPRNTDLFRSKNFSSSFLVFDNIFDLEKVLSHFSAIQMSPLILEDSTRSLFLLQKRRYSVNFVKKKKKRPPILSDFFSPKIIKGIFSKKKGTKWKIFPEENNSFFSGAFPKNFFRIFHFLKFSIHLIKCLKKIFKIPFKYTWSLKEFESYLFSEILNLSISNEFFKLFSHHSLFMMSRLGVFQYRYFNGLKIFSKFIELFGVYSQSSNENIKVSFSPYFRKSGFFSDPILTLSNLESGHILRSIIENFKVFLICTNTFTEIKFYLSIIDCIFPIFGAIRLSFKKKFVFSIWASFNSEESLGLSASGPKQEDFFSKISSIVLSRIFEKTHHGIICFFPTNYHLNKLLQNWEKDKTLKEIFKERQIFIETWDLETNLSTIENYKLCCDFGRKAIFLGIYKGILAKVQLKYHYSRIVLLFGDSIQQTTVRSEIFRKQFNILTKKKIPKNILNLLVINEERGFLMNKFFNSKKDFGVFFIIEYEKKTKKKIFFSKYLQFLGKKQNYWDIEEISKKLKNFFISWNIYF